MIIAVDFDGTIVEHKYPKIGKEVPFAIATLKKLQAERHLLILWSVREGKLLDWKRPSNFAVSADWSFMPSMPTIRMKQTTPFHPARSMPICISTTVISAVYLIGALFTRWFTIIGRMNNIYIISIIMDNLKKFRGGRRCWENKICPPTPKTQNG